MNRKEIQEAHEKYYPEYDAQFKDMKMETQCIHTGQNPEWIYGSVNVPIYATSTFELPHAGDPCGKWCYSRVYNPTKLALKDYSLKSRAVLVLWLSQQGWLRLIRWLSW